MANTTPPTSVNCPTCGKAIDWTPASVWRPFCSRRCKLIDLGEWLDEGHRIPGEEPPAGDPETPNHSN